MRHDHHSSWGVRKLALRRCVIGFEVKRFEMHEGRDSGVLLSHLSATQQIQTSEDHHSRQQGVEIDAGG